MIPYYSAAQSSNASCSQIRGRAGVSRKKNEISWSLGDSSFVLTRRTRLAFMHRKSHTGPSIRWRCQKPIIYFREALSRGFG
jgi:hypothetical protein